MPSSLTAQAATLGVTVPTDHMLDQLADQLTRVEEALAPVLQGGHPFPLPPEDSDVDAPTPEDVRGEVARAISGNALRADRQANTIYTANRRLSALLEALEV